MPTQDTFTVSDPEKVKFQNFVFFSGIVQKSPPLPTSGGKTGRLS